MQNSAKLSIDSKSKEMLRSTQRREFFRRFFEGLVSLGLISLALIGVLYALEIVFDPSLEFRSALGAIAVASLLAAYLKVLQNIVYGPSDLEIAWKIEAALEGKLKSRLATLVEFQKRPPESLNPQTIHFLEQCDEQIRGLYPQDTPTKSISWKSLQKGILGLILMIVVVGFRIDWNFRSVYHLAVRFVAPALGIELPLSLIHI